MILGAASSLLLSLLLGACSTSLPWSTRLHLHREVRHMLLLHIGAADVGLVLPSTRDADP